MVYVGGLTVTLHNVWADAAVALQKAKYPNMQQVGDRYGVSNSVEDGTDRYNADGGDPARVAAAGVRAGAAERR